MFSVCISSVTVDGPKITKEKYEKAKSLNKAKIKPAANN